MTGGGSGPKATDERIARILDRIRGIPEGFVRTYGDIDPAAPRLVGRVLAETEQELPWHRVVRSDGSVAKGALQLRLLRGEGVPLRGKRVDMEQARIPE
jgi:methylated-DNA-protein-cysteine methyltransferase-like protein